jgi:mono/diheme cytochrome c family protein
LGSNSLNSGRQVFLDYGCGGCHSIDGLTAGTVGPDLSRIGTEAGTMVPGLSAEELLIQSILEPNAFIVEGFQANIMPNNYGELISIEQLDDVVAFLLAQQ